jgi:hypothetical protein
MTEIPDELKSWLENLVNGAQPSFQESVSCIETHYAYTPTEFSNGQGADLLINPAGSNEGSCKIFAFARIHKLSQTLTLALFGDFYRNDVLGNPQGSDHRNIRNFIRYGWDGIAFQGEALRPRHSSYS